jgi:hypothetical protein
MTPGEPPFFMGWFCFEGDTVGRGGAEDQGFGSLAGEESEFVSSGVSRGLATTAHQSLPFPVPVFVVVAVIFCWQCAARLGSQSCSSFVLSLPRMTHDG